MTFAPKQTTVAEFALVREAEATADRPDLGIGAQGT